jgi:hypothetical protein
MKKAKEKNRKLKDAKDGNFQIQSKVNIKEEDPTVKHQKKKSE